MAIQPIPESFEKKLKDGFHGIPVNYRGGREFPCLSFLIYVSLFCIERFFFASA
jgi:hypothetical protein